jgi:tRNA nucleotidyltransferase/poly(A) polymerase
MADYIYLLENRLSPAQRSAIQAIRDVARAKSLTVFLVGGAVRDLTSGSPVRDLDLVVQGNASKLKKDIEKAGAVLTGESDATQALYLRFPGNVRVELGSTLAVTYPKPGKPAYKPSTILDDLRRRDFTANAMALSLNDGSYGLLMDPLNGIADIENRELRLVGNYGFIEDPVRMIRGARLMARLGWVLEEKTQTRYETGRQEGYISVLSDFARGYELEEIFYEQDPLRVLKRLEAEGWMKVLAPAWTSAKVNLAELGRLHEVQSQLELQGIHADASAAHFPLLTSKLTPAEVKALKTSFPRQGFVAQIEALEGEGKEFSAQLSAKTAAAPSQAWKLITGSRPEIVLWVAFSSKSSVLQAKFKAFLGEWPQARQKIPYALMQEMRIVPELPGYNDLLETLYFELMDSKLTTTEEMKAFLEPYSPPAPPPPVNLRRLRAAAKKEAKGAKGRAKKLSEAADAETDELEVEVESPVDAGTEEEEDEETPVAEPAKPEKKPAAAPPAAKVAAVAVLEQASSKAPAKTPATPAAKASVPAKTAPAKAAPVNAIAAKKSVPVREAAAKVVAAKKAAPPAKVPANKQAGKSNPKPVQKVAAKPAAAKKAAAPAPAKKAVKKAAPPPVKKAVKKQPIKPVAKAKPVPKKLAKAAPKAALKPAKKAIPAKKVPAKKTVPVKKKR